MRAIVLAIVAAASAVALLAQAPAPRPQSTGKSAVPRAADGKPDLTGVWQGGSKRRGTWEQANNGLGVGGIGTDPTAPPSLASQQVITDPAPYKPEAAARVLALFNRRGIDDPAALCLPLGVPRVTLVGLFPIQIVQTPQQIVILYEYMNIFRVIPLNATHPADLVPTYMGDSVGHWEGDTLVVDVIGFNDESWIEWPGWFHSNNMHVIEKLTRVGNTLKWEAIVEDPDVLMEPYHVEGRTLRLNPNAKATLTEDLPCEERDSQHMVTHERG